MIRKGLRTAVACVAAGVVLAWLVAGCGASQRERTIRDTFAATDAAAAGFVAFDGRHQHDLVVAAKSEPEGKAALEMWRVNQLRAEMAIAAVYRAIAVAATIEDDKSLEGMIQAALILSQELKAIGVIQ